MYLFRSFDHSTDSTEGLLHVRHCSRSYRINMNKKQIRDLQTLEFLLIRSGTKLMESQRLTFHVQTISFCCRHVLSKENRLRGNGNAY